MTINGAAIIPDAAQESSSWVNDDDIGYRRHTCTLPESKLHNGITQPQFVRNIHFLTGLQVKDLTFEPL